MSTRGEEWTITLHACWRLLAPASMSATGPAHLLAPHEPSGTRAILALRDWHCGAGGSVCPQPTGSGAAVAPYWHCGAGGSGRRFRLPPTDGEWRSGSAIL